MSFERSMESTRDQSTLASVMGLLGVAAAFTALGAFIGLALGIVGFWVALIGGFVTLLVLRAARDVAPLNLVLLGLFAILEGVVLGQLLELYVSAGMGFIVVHAAGATAVAAVATGACRCLTRRELGR